MGIGIVAESQERETVQLGQSPVEHQPPQQNGKAVICAMGSPQKGCLASAEISQSHKNPLNQRMPENKKDFLVQISVTN